MELKFDLKCHLPYPAGLLKFLTPKKKKKKILQLMRLFLGECTKFRHYNIYIYIYIYKLT